MKVKEKAQLRVDYSKMGLPEINSLIAENSATLNNLRFLNRVNSSENVARIRNLKYQIALLNFIAHTK